MSLRIVYVPSGFSDLISRQNKPPLGILLLLVSVIAGVMVSVSFQIWHRCHDTRTDTGVSVGVDTAKSRCHPFLDLTHTLFEVEIFGGCPKFSRRPTPPTFLQNSSDLVRSVSKILNFRLRKNIFEKNICKSRFLLNKMAKNSWGVSLEIFMGCPKFSVRDGCRRRRNPPSNNVWYQSTV